MKDNLPLITLKTFEKGHNSEIQSHALLGAGEVAWELEVESSTLLLSENWIRFLGYTAFSEMPSNKWQYYIHADDFDTVLRDWETFTAEKKAVFYSEHRVKNSANEYLWVAVKGALQKDPEEQSLILFGTIQNIDKRKRTEQALQDSEKKFASAFKYASIGMALVDRKGKFIQVNPALCDLLHYTENELVTKTFQEITHPEDLERDLSLLEDLTAGKIEKYELEKRYFTKHGDTIWIMLSASCMFSKTGDVEYYIAQIQNIQERKKYEAELIEAKKIAEQDGKNKANFLNTMAHEIRTPMNSIIGYTHLLLSEQYLPHQKEELEAIKFTSKHLHSLVSDILDFNKLEAGKMELQNSNIHIEQFLKSVLAAFKPQAEEQGIELKLMIDSEMPKEIVADSGQLQLAVSNLVSNAVKFTQQGQVSIHVTAKKIEGNQVRFHIAIQDTGIGIAKKDHSLIFENFKQLDIGFRKKHRGTGLGLSIVKKVIENMGGTVEVQSEWGKGSTFTITLTTAASFNKPAQSNTQDMKKDLKGYHILIAEDNRINLTMTAKFLEKWGATVAKAQDGQEAVDLAKNQDFSLILMDLQMPKKNGYEATLEIMQNGNHSPIVALTAFCTSDLKAQAREHGMIDFITKPFNPDDLHQKILQNAVKPRKVA